MTGHLWYTVYAQKRLAKESHDNLPTCNKLFQSYGQCHWIVSDAYYHLQLNIIKSFAKSNNKHFIFDSQILEKYSIFFFVILGRSYNISNINKKIKLDAQSK